jgi:hypothetical protein
MENSNDPAILPIEFLEKHFGAFIRKEELLKEMDLQRLNKKRIKKN